MVLRREKRPACWSWGGPLETSRGIRARAEATNTSFRLPVPVSPGFYMSCLPPRFTLSPGQGQICHNIPYAALTCRRPIKMSPLCQFEMTLPTDFPGGVWGDGSTDERWGVVTARGAAGFGSAAIEGGGRGTAAGARAPSGISAVEGLPH